MRSANVSLLITHDQRYPGGIMTAETIEPATIIPKSKPEISGQNAETVPRGRGIGEKVETAVFVSPDLKSQSRALSFRKGHKGQTVKAAEKNSATSASHAPGTFNIEEGARLQARQGGRKSAGNAS